MKQTSMMQVFGYFRKHLKTEKFFLVLIVSASISSGIMSLIPPIFYKEIIDIVSKGLVSDKSTVLSQLTAIFGFIALTYVGIWIAWRVLEYAATRLEIKLMGNIYNECFSYLHRHSYRFFSNNFSGALVKRINRLVGGFEGFVDVFVFEIIRFLVAFIFVIGVVGYQNIYLGVLFGIWIILFGIISYFLNKWHYKYRLKAVEEDSIVSGTLSDTITNNFNISIFGSIEREYSYFKSVVGKRQKVSKESWIRSNIIYGTLSVFSIIMELFMLFLAIQLWYKDEITIGTFVLIVSYQIVLGGQLFSIGHIFKKINTTFGNASEMIEILNTPHEIKDEEYAENIKTENGKIEFTDIDFEYNKGVQIFENLNLTINAGEKVAFVGHSGSGKSSIIKLLFRFYDIQGGKISIDGQDIAKYNQQSVRSSIAMVPQDPILFHRSLYENIAYSNPEADQNSIIKVSKMAHCHEFISKFPQGYDTLVGERGIKLSGGERQRIAIARAILSSAKIMVLDEATSSLDSQSENFIQEAIENLIDNKTLIVIAHRLSTIMKMDRIIVMDKGKIIEQGNHYELLQIPNGVYRNLWEIQSGGFIE